MINVSSHINHIRTLRRWLREKEPLETILWINESTGGLAFIDHFARSLVKYILSHFYRRPVIKTLPPSLQHPMNHRIQPHQYNKNIYTSKFIYSRCLKFNHIFACKCFTLCKNSVYMEALLKGGAS